MSARSQRNARTLWAEAFAADPPGELSEEDREWLNMPLPEGED